MRLHKDKKLFGQAVSNTASYFKVDPSIVEKDYYVTLFLEELTKRIMRISLLMCYMNRLLMIEPL